MGNRETDRIDLHRRLPSARAEHALKANCRSNTRLKKANNVGEKISKKMLAIV
jgi:hypothetical protein